MTVWPDYLKPLENLTRPFPRKAMEEAVARREESIPYLLEALEWTAANAEEVSNNFMLHEYALFLLAQFRESRACEPVVRLARHSDVEDLLGDTITEGLGPVLASVSGGDPRPIQALVEDDEADEYARAAGLNALGALFRAKLLPRGELSEYLESLFRERLRREPSHVWDCLISICTAAGMTEHLESIRAAFRDGLADPGFDSLESVEGRLRIGNDKIDRKRFRLIDDAIDEMEGWYCFTPEAAEDERRFESLEESAEIEATGQAPDFEPPELARRHETVRAEPKPGRNDPCPCGSGRKYKKCCG